MVKFLRDAQIHYSMNTEVVGKPARREKLGMVHYENVTTLPREQLITHYEKKNPLNQWALNDENLNKYGCNKNNKSVVNSKMFVYDVDEGIMTPAQIMSLPSYQKHGSYVESSSSSENVTIKTDKDGNQKHEQYKMHIFFFADIMVQDIETWKFVHKSLGEQLQAEARELGHELILDAALRTPSQAISGSSFTAPERAGHVNKLNDQYSDFDENKTLVPVATYIEEFLRTRRIAKLDADRKLAAKAEQLQKRRDYANNSSDLSVPSEEVDGVPVEAIKLAVSIYEQEYGFDFTDINEAGWTTKTLECPFEDHTKSDKPFGVDPVTGMGHCFACDHAYPVEDILIKSGYGEQYTRILQEQRVAEKRIIRSAKKEIKETQTAGEEVSEDLLLLAGLEERLPFQLPEQRIKLPEFEHTEMVDLKFISNLSLRFNQDYAFKAPTGNGKTTLFKYQPKRLLRTREDARITIVTELDSLSNNLVRIFEDELKEEFPDVIVGRLTADNCNFPPQVTISTIAGLGKLPDDYYTDLLIFDEVEADMRVPFSGVMRGDERLRNYMSVRNLIIRAGVVMIFDAGLDNFIPRQIKHWRRNRKVAWNQVLNTYKMEEIEHLHSSWSGTLLQAIDDYRAGKSLLITATRKSRDVQSALIACGIPVLLINGDTKNGVAEREFLRDPETAFKAAHEAGEQLAVIMSPTGFTGLSVKDVPNLVAFNLHYANGGRFATPSSMAQASSRARNPEAKHTWVENFKPENPITRTPLEIFKESEAKSKRTAKAAGMSYIWDDQEDDTGQTAAIRQEMNMFDASLQSESQFQSTDHFGYYVAYREQNGVTFKLVDDAEGGDDFNPETDNFKATVSEVRKELKSSDVLTMVERDVIDYDDYRQLQIENKGSLDVELAHKAFKIQEATGQLRTNEGLLERFFTKGKRRQQHNFALLFATNEDVVKTDKRDIFDNISSGRRAHATRKKMLGQMVLSYILGKEWKTAPKWVDSLTVRMKMGELRQRFGQDFIDLGLYGCKRNGTEDVIYQFYNVCIYFGVKLTHKNRRRKVTEEGNEDFIRMHTIDLTALQARKQDLFKKSISYKAGKLFDEQDAAMAALLEVEILDDLKCEELLSDTNSNRGSSQSTVEGLDVPETLDLAVKQYMKRFEVGFSEPIPLQ